MEQYKGMTKNKYQLSNANELFDCLGGGKYSSQIDLMSGYHKVHNKDHFLNKNLFSCYLLNLKFNNDRLFNF